MPVVGGGGGGGGLEPWELLLFEQSEYIDQRPMMVIIVKEDTRKFIVLTFYRL